MKEKIKDAGLLEWIFGVIALVWAIPVLLAYFIVNLIIGNPIRYIAKKFWT
tara:strand:+ start:97 stop:249 length:153 start_codon:yes stop_codon:yes gene_type:complete